jgi:hypothetical protein
MSKPSKKHKEFSITHYYRGMELQVIAVTTSVKKFSELTGISPHHVKTYAYSFEPRTKECIENPDIVYAKSGLGGEIRKVFDKDIVYTFMEFKAKIDEYGGNYSTYRDYLTKTNQDE